MACKFAMILILPQQYTYVNVCYFMCVFKYQFDISWVGYLNTTIFIMSLKELTFLCIYYFCVFYLPVKYTGAGASNKNTRMMYWDIFRVPIYHSWLHDQGHFYHIIIDLVVCITNKKHVS